MMKLFLAMPWVLGILFFMPDASAQTVNFNANGSYVVPAGVTLIRVTSKGGGGGGSGGDYLSNGSIGGKGAQVVATVPVTAGETLTITMGRGGGVKTPNANQVGAGATRAPGGIGWFYGGAGGQPSACCGGGGGGGGGGGSTGLLRGSAPLVVAGGGAGAGGGSNGVSGFAGADSTDTSSGSGAVGGTGNDMGNVDGAGGGGGGGGCTGGVGGPNQPDWTGIGSGAGAGTSCIAAGVSSAQYSAGGGIGGAPGGSDGGQIQPTVGADGSVAIVPQLTSWNGANMSGTGTVNGGTGTWNSTASNWTSSTGVSSGIWANGGTAVFRGAAGTVTVDASLGAANIAAMTFSTTGYTLAGGALTGTNATNVITTDPGINATIGNAITGGNAYTKAGTGTLTLSGSNTYTGLTTVSAGTLLLANASGTLRPNNHIVVNSGGTVTTTASGANNFVYALDGIGTGTITLNSGGKATTGNDAAITLRGQSFILAGGELSSGTPATAWGSWILDEGSAVTANTSSVISASNLNLRAANTNFTVASGQTLNVTGTLTTSIGGGTPSGTNGGFTKLGAGTMALAGLNTYAGITTVNAGKLDVVIQNGLPVNGGVVINNSGTLITSAGHLWGTAAGTGTATINSGGTLTTANGIQSVIYRPLVLNGGTLASGTPDITFGSWRIGGPVSVTADSTISATSISTGNIVFTVNTGSVLSANGVVRDDFYGVSALNKTGAGTMTLSAANTYTGATTISAGKALINGSQPLATGAISVGSGATLGGIGTLGGAVTINSGGTLAPGTSPGVITMAGLTLPIGAILAMELGQAGVVGGTFNDRVQVNGNLTLGGGTVNVTVPTTPAGTFTPGTYRLIDYTGTLTNSGGLVVGTLPAGFASVDMYIDVNSSLKQVNLVVRGSGYVNWDVAPQNDGVVNGGTGIWNAGVAGGSTNWTSSAGTANSGWYGGGTAVFGGTAGAVTVDNALGAINIGGLTFNTTGYTLSGGTINGSAVSNVLTAGAGVTATVGSLITGGPYVKQGPGTVLLSGANISYIAATSVTGGTLALKDNGIYYSSSPTSVASGATLKLIATANQSNRDTPITLASGAILEHEGLLNWTVWGPVVTGTGTTTINQTSTSTGALGRGFYPDGGLAGSGTVTINGGNAGSGVNFRMAKSTFSGTIVVNGIASTTPFSGSGIGVAGSETSLQNIDFTVNGTMELGITGIGWANNAASAFTMGALNGTGVVVSNSPTGGVTKMLTIGNTNTAGSFSGVIANGNGTVTSLVKSGSAAQTLSGLNTYGGTTTASGGTLKLGINGALPLTTAVTVASGATLDLQGTTQSVKSIASAGTVALGTTGNLTLTNGASNIGAITGTGTITVNTGATLTLTAALANTGINIVLNGGTLNLGSLTHTIGTLTVNANSTLDFSSAGNAQLTATSLTMSASNTLAITNWTRTSDHFYATAFVGATRNITGTTPMNRITLGANAATATVWQTDDEITLQLDPKLRISKTSNGGIGSFAFQLTGLSATNDSIATVTSGVAVQGIATIKGTSGVAVTVAESGVPAGWPTNPLSASCLDANGTNNANGTTTFGTLTGNTLSITAAHMLQGADIACSFVNTLNAISGTVFNDGGAPTAGANTGIPNDGLQNGSEAGLAGVGVGLTNCASVTHATATTDSAGRYALSAPAAAVGQTVCVQPMLIAGQRSTGANVEGTVTPDGGTTTVGGTAFVYGRATSRQSFIEPASGTRTLNFGLVPESTLAANSSKSAAAGATALHAHTFVAGTGGSVSFASGTATATPPMAGWNEVMYLNPACATSLPPGATKLSPPSVAQSVLQGQTVCFFVQAFVPASAVNGSSNSVPVIATMTFTNAAPLLTATYTVTDVTTSGNSALSLQKEVRNITTGGAWGTSNQAKSGDTLEYRISYVNPSAAPLSTVVITDGTNLYTTFVSANASTTSSALGSCTLNTPNNPAPAAGVACTPLHLGSGKGTVRWEFSGTLAPGASGSVTYSVLVD